MWDSYQARMRAKEKARKSKSQSLAARLRLPGVPVNIKYAQVNAQPVLIEGFLTLSDLNPAGMTVFLEETLLSGSEVSITLEEPRQFYVKGRTISCLNYLANTKVIFEKALAYRVGIQFKFENPEESEEVKKYCKYIYEEVIRRGR